VADDIALPFGSLRLKPKGSAAGHNGLRNIEEILGTQHYGRLRFGIGNNYPPGKQVDYVLGQFEPKELEQISAHVKKASEMVKSFCLSGADVTMNLYN
ncbi:MAG: aminoacyl-tRNA hydrolase, partial [Tannerella sp.]|jgi:PTH1 family peptidyl-tRNA hydrolase|nr:aminoacyl-tRNA hydrolase [Tannerella sp.]